VRNRSPRNIAASVRDRLLDRSRTTGEDFQFLLQRYAAERFLHRLGGSPHCDRYVLKGAMLFALWGGAIYRATRDLDFTGYGSSDVTAVVAAMREVCAVSVPDDGLAFDAATLTGEAIRDSSEYNGLRLRLQAMLGVARIPMQIDIGFGNAVEPPATEADYPTLLDMPAPRVRAYPREAVVAEKLHAMVVLGERNSRYKDFYDLYVFARQFSFVGERLKTAIGATFQRRHTGIEPALPAALAPRFYTDGERARQWRAYLTRNNLPGAPADWASVGELLQQFLARPWRAVADGRALSDTWLPRGPWAPSITQGAAITETVQNRLRQFKPYPVYKNSVVEWLGEIPAHWEVARLKRVFVVVNGATPQSGIAGYWDGEIPWVTPEDLGGLAGSEINAPRRRITQVGYQSCGTTLAPAGSLVLSTRAPIGHLAIAAMPLCTNQGCRSLVFRMPRAPRFFYFQLLAARPELEALGQGSTFKELAKDKLEEVAIADPPAAEQCAIAAFLDRETAKIDALMAKKQQLIALLQEKRTALITRAATKGLDPNAPMKESGVEWLSKIPAHWEVKRLWHLTPSGRRIMYGIVLPGPNVDDGVPTVKGGDVSSDRLRLERLNRTTREIEAGYVRSRLRGGDLVYAIRGSIGEVAMVPDELEGANLTQDAARIAYTPATEGHWLLYALRSSAAFAQLDAGALGATISGINIRDLKRALLPVPPRVEQEVIAAFLDRQTAKLDAMVTKVREAIERLKELRSAVISAAVTGKIDVREEAA
jgi:type I restriction enzyme, S subunit